MNGMAVNVTEHGEKTVVQTNKGGGKMQKGATVPPSPPLNGPERTLKPLGISRIGSCLETLSYIYSSKLEKRCIQISWAGNKFLVFRVRCSSMVTCTLMV